MKKLFTYFAASVIALGASAGEWVAPAEGPVAAGTVLVDDAVLKATTVYDANISASNAELDGVAYTHTMNVRIDKAPSADYPYGTEKDGSTSVILDVKQATDITFFFRRQFKDGYAAADGKDMCLYGADLQQIKTGVLTVVEEVTPDTYANCTETFSLEAGTYVLAARGTTLGLFTFTYTEENAPEPVGNGLWVAPEEGPVAAGTVLVNDDLLKATTVYDANVGEFVGTLYGETYNHTMNVRVAAWPNADNPNGTEQSGSTPVVIEVKDQPLAVTFFFRRQYKDGYAAADGKDMALFNSDCQQIKTGELIVVEETTPDTYANCTERFILEPGTYTLAAKGTTLGLFCFSYSTDTTVISNIAADENDGEAVYYNLNGVRVANPANGLYIKVQGGKASKVLVK